MHTPKLRELIGCLGTVPGVLWQQLVQRPRTCRMIRHHGRGADLHKVQLYFTSLPGVCLEGANLSQAHLLDVDLHGADLSNANLSYAILHQVNLQAATLGRANLHSAGLLGTNLQNADLKGADLTRAKLLNPERWWPRELLSEPTSGEPHRKRRYQTSLAGADLTGAILIGADLWGVDLTGAKLTGVRADVRTRWPEGFDLQQHGVVIPPMAREWQLKRDKVVLGILQDCLPDYSSPIPWFRAYFSAAAAFDAIRPHFEEMVRCFNTEPDKDYLEAYAPIRALALQLESPEGEIIEPDFLHIEGEEARFRY